METPSYYLDNPFQLLRQKRREAEERRRAAYVEKHGPTRVFGLQKPQKRGPRYELKMRLLDLLRARGERIRLAQGNACYLCGSRFSGANLPTKDHVVPKVLGGRNRLNILIACLTCNWKKGQRHPTPAELDYLRAINVAVANDEVVGPRVFRCAAE